jgi:hypothetical protein
MKSAFWRATALLMALTFVLPAVALAGGQAGEVSHSALMGSTLINTSAQLNTWTHWAKNYGNYTEINTQSLNGGPYGPQGTLIWDYDDNNTLLFRVRDMDLGSQNTGFMFGPSAPMLSDFTGISSYNAATNGQMINMALARNLTQGAFSVGAFVADNTAKDNGSTPNTEMGSKAFGGQFTWGNGQDLDVAVSFSHGATTDNDGTIELKDSANIFDAYGRYMHNQWIYQFGGYFGSGTDEYDNAGTVESDDVNAMGLMVNVGQLLKDDADGQVSAEFYLQYMADKYKPAGGGEDKYSDIYFPGMRTACTQKVSDHFGVLLGADASWGIMGHTDDIGGATTDTKYTEFNFDWSGGIFWENADGFRVTGEFVQNNLDYAFSLGNDVALVSRLEATYKF